MEGHHEAFHKTPNPARIEFWFREARSPERLLALCAKYPDIASAHVAKRPLLDIAIRGDLTTLRVELDAEKRRQQEKDRIHWEPLKREIEKFRRMERDTNRIPDGL